MDLYLFVGKPYVCTHLIIAEIGFCVPAAEVIFNYRCEQVLGREMAELIIPLCIGTVIVTGWSGIASWGKAEFWDRIQWL